MFLLTYMTFNKNYCQERVYGKLTEIKIFYENVAHKN